MLYIDYRWDLEPERILLDEELDTGKLGWNEGDYFRVKVVNGRKVLVKIDAIEKFILDGTNNNE